jgi:hypothetical protein
LVTSADDVRRRVKVARSTRRSPAGDDRSRRYAAWLFVVVIVVALPLIMYQARDQWFFLDEFDFLATRSTGFHDLLRPHNEHWSTLPILVYRALWHVVGLRHYWPYQLCVVLEHLAVAVLLRAVMRRAGVNPWIATAAAGLFAVLGSGRQDIVWAFQMGFTGSVMFGLGHLLLADHDGPFDWRDWAGIACGLAALMCSGVGVSMVAAVGIATAIRRGWRVAIVHVGGLGAVFLAWWVGFARSAYASGSTSVGQVVRFVRLSVGNAFVGMGHLPGVGTVLGLVLVAGAALLATSPDRRERLRAAAGPIGLLGGALMFAFVSGYGRAAVIGPAAPFASRYVHVLSAMVLPAVGVAATAIAQRLRFALPILVALFVAGVPGNVVALRAHGSERYVVGAPQLVLSYPRVPQATIVPRSTTPVGILLEGATIGWLLDGVKSGRIPDPGRVPEATRALAGFMLSVKQDNSPTGGNCTNLPPRIHTKLIVGQHIPLTHDTVDIRLLVHGQPGPRLSFNAFGGSTVTVLAGPLDVIVIGRGVRVCG